MKPRAYYQPYQSGLLLAQAFSPSKTPLLRMEHLRQLDFPISREISYERTVDEFLLQLAVNDALRALRSRKDMVILLNEEGALIREGTAGQSIDSPQERQALAQEIAAFAEQYGLAGIDIDWEFPLDDEWEDFSTFLITLKDTLSRNSEPVALSLALYPEEIALSEEAIAALDRIHMMAYDQFDSEGFHSTMQAAEDAVAYFTALGASPQQLVLGIPAYGRPLDGSAQWVFYKDIDPESISGENPDLVGDISFNSTATAAQKTQYALEQNLSGVMVYQLLCDRNDQDALILACANMAENA